VRRHFSAEVLALHREGAVSPRKAGRIAAHLSACSLCSGVDSDLAAVPGVLAATQFPPMPATLAERISMAIAGEAVARASASAAPWTAPAAPETGVTGVPGAGAGDRSGPGAVAGAGGGPDAGEPGHIPGRPDLPERSRGRSRRFRMPNWSSPLVLRGLAAAGAVVVIAGAGLLLAHGQTGSGTSAGAGSGGGQPTSRRQAEPRPVAGSALHAGSAGGPVSLRYRGRNGRFATARALNSGKNYSKRNLAPMVRTAVASAPPITTGVTPGTSQQPASSPAEIGGIRLPLLAGCLSKVSAGRTILVADIARYLGRPATIVVLRSSDKARVLQVVVVSLSCSAAIPDIIAQLTVPAG
jgi:hypothetical protein